MAQSWRGFRKNVSILSACWALNSTSNLLLVTVSVLTGHLLAVDKSLAALPIALQWLGTASTTAMIFLILLGAAIFNAFLGFSELPIFAADFFRDLGEEKTIALLGDLMRYDNCPDLVNAVRHEAEAVWPGATHRYLSI